MEATRFTQYQQNVTDLMGHVESNEQMEEISDLLSQYFAQKAIEAADKLWDEGQINANTIEDWKHEHMCTPYSSIN